MTKLAALVALAALLAVPVRAQAPDMSSAMGGNCMMQQLQKLCGDAKPGSPDFKACSKEHARDAAMACQSEAHDRGYAKAHDELKKDSPCMDDSKKFCAGKYPGTPEYSNCMKAHESQLSPECVAFGKKRAHMGPANDGACGADAKKLCPEDGPGSPKFMPCMMAHYDDLSPECQAKFKGAKKARR